MSFPSSWLEFSNLEYTQEKFGNYVAIRIRCFAKSLLAACLGPRTKLNCPGIHVGSTFNGADVVVAAEKTGLEFGDMSVFHRLVESRVDKGPVFSMANLLKPGSFDMQQVHKLETPGLSLFMTLPGPLTALDAWDAMLPTAQRLAELLNGLVLDEERNAIGRQRIQFMRDELRAYDRDKEKNTIRKHW